MFDTFWILLPAISSWLIRIGAFIIVPFRRSPDAARTWLLLFFVLPWIALPIYLAIGRPRHSPERRERFARLPEVLDRAFDAPLYEAVQSEASGVVGSTETLICSLCRMPPLDGNRVELLPDYADSIARLIDDIDAASIEVHLEFYIVADDATGRSILDALERAHARGVRCRMLMDAMGSWSSARAIEKRLKRNDIAVARILPLTRRWRSSRLDLGNHRKIASIDERIAHTGSQNLIDACSATGLANRELVVRVEGAAVLALQSVFVGDWYLETGEQIRLHGGTSAASNDDAPPADSTPAQGKAFSHERAAPRAPAGNVLDEVRAQVLPSGPDFPVGGVDTLFTSLIHDAIEEVVLVTPYFIPNAPLAQALSAAALAGVRVTLILSARSDSVLVGLAQKAWYEQLLVAGVHIRRHHGAFLHAKHLRIDERFSVIGSSNMDMRSFELNAEISLILYGKPVAQALAAIERDLLVTADTLDLDDWRDRPLPLRLRENSARLFAELL